MITFSLDCSQRSLCLALSDETRGLFAARLETPAEPLSAVLPARIGDLFETAGVAPEGIGRVLFCRGPGSFTSLRVGLATLFGLFPELTGTGGRSPEFLVVSSLLSRVVSAGLKESRNDTIAVFLKAGREKFYFGKREPSGEFSEHLMNWAEAEAWLRTCREKTLVCGDALPEAIGDGSGRLPAGVIMCPGDPISPEGLLAVLARREGVEKVISLPVTLHYLMAPNLGK